MSYSVIYSNEFDSLDNLLTLRLQIEKKDFTGSPIDIILSGNPIIQEWQEDDQKAPIRGCTLKVNIITDSSGIALTDFYSDDDNTFKAILKRAQTDEVLFVGYLLQDDCAELYVDFNHEISLTFTDHLALLKDIRLNEAAVNIGGPTVISAISISNLFPIANNAIGSLDPRIGVLQNGDAFSLFDGATTYNFICYNISYNSILGYLINIGIVVPFAGTITFDLTYTAPVVLDGYFSLAQILRLCLRSTDLDLNTTVASSLYPVGGSTQELVLDTFLDITTFQKANEWMTCYDILEIIMSRFNASLFQAHGRWFIVRFDEIYRYFGAAKPIYTVNVYNYEFVPGGASANITQHEFADSTEQETGVIKSIVRPYQFVKETFNYNQNENLLKNPNLQELGNFRSQYIDANTNLIKEYELPYWVNWDGNPGGYVGPYCDKYIRIAYNNDIASEDYGDELYRNLVLTGDGPTQHALQSNDIYLSAGDAFNYTFQVASGLNINGPHLYGFSVRISNGTTTYWLDMSGYWQTTYQAFNNNSFHLLSGDNLDGLHSWTVAPLPVPINGVLNVFLFIPIVNWGANEMYYRNFSFTVSSYYAGSNVVIGQTHEEYQLNNIKNNIDKEIFIDNSPSWYIAGTLFLESYNGLLRNRCRTWKYQSGTDVYITLGGVATAEALWTNYILRNKYELTYRHLYENDKILTPFSCFVNYLEGTTKQYIPGKMTIDYKSANCNLTLREIVSNVDGITSPQIDEFIAFFAARFYEFNYIHEKS
jgi:hypothetical protein